MFINFKGRIVLAAITLLTLSMMTLAYVSYKQESSIVVDDINKYSRLRVTNNSMMVHEFIDKIKRGIEKSSNLFSTNVNEGHIIEKLKLIQLTTQASAVVAGFEDGVAFNSNKGRYDSSYDPRSRAWYQDAKNQRKTIMTNVYTGSSTGKLMVSIASPFYKNGNLNGVLLADIELAGLQLMIDNTVFEGAIATLFDKQGLVLASTNKQLQLGESKLSDISYLSTIKEAILGKTLGQSDYSINQQQKIAFYQEIIFDDSTGWHLLVELDKSVAYAAINHSLQATLITTLILVIICSILIYLLLSYTYRPVLALKQTISDLSHGDADLTKRLPVTSRDDLGQISQDINTFIANLQTMVIDITTASNKIGSCIDGLQSLSGENKNVLTQHKSETYQIVTALEEMSTTSSDVARNTSDAVTFTSKTNNQTELSKVAVRDATDTVINLVKNVDDVSNSIVDMGNQISEITKVLDVIGGIAAQTNLLALNAAIEAARAGEYGRGFAVVADEVRALASRTQESTTEIQETINRLTASGDNVTSTIVNTKSSCEVASSKISLIVEDLDSIGDSVENINNINIQIATAAEQQSSVSEELNRNMLTISEMAELIAISGENVNQEANSLVSANDQLIGIVQRFKLQ